MWVTSVWKDHQVVYIDAHVKMVFNHRTSGHSFGIQWFNSFRSLFHVGPPKLVGL